MISTKSLRFPYRVPLLNASLVERDATLARECLDGTVDSRGATTALHDYIARLWSAPYVTSFMGGRSSLFAIVRALGLGAGDQVMVPAFTCQAVTNAFSFCGVELVFVDIELDTFGMSVERAKKSITARTKALLLQHTFGLVSRDTDALCVLAKENDLRVIEDCAHATGAQYKGRMVGTFGDVSFFSSERSKIVSTVHGGWAITSDRDIGEALAKIHAVSPEPGHVYTDALLGTLCTSWIRNQENRGAAVTKSWRAFAEQHSFQEIPQMQTAELNGLFTQQYNWRMPEPIAAILLPQLESLPSNLARRRRAATFWSNWVIDNGLSGSSVQAGAEPSWVRFPVLVSAEVRESRAALGNKLNCDIGGWFGTPMYPLPLALAGCPNGARASQMCINLPTWLPDGYGG